MSERGGEKMVLAFGTFDLLHPGHVHFLENAAGLGDRLVVVVTRDERVLEERGHQPVMSLEDRLAVVGSLKRVDRAVAGDVVGEWTVLLHLKPDVVAVGYDQSADHPGLLRQLEEMKRRPKLVRLSRKGNHSSTSLRRRVLDERKS